MKHSTNKEHKVSQYPAHRTPQAGGLSGRLAEQSPLTSYDPNMTLVPHTFEDTLANPASKEAQVFAQRPHQQNT